MDSFKSTSLSAISIENNRECHIMSDNASKPQRARLSKNFFVDEFNCGCGQCAYSDPKIAPWDILELKFMQKLQDVRDDLGIAMTVNSGARCVDYNQHVGGAAYSGHIVGIDRPCKAADIGTHDMTPAQRHDLLRLAMKHGFRGIGIARNFIHLDTKVRKAVWSY